MQDYPSDKASVTFHVQAPVGYQVLANGTLEKVDTLPYGHLVWNYRMDRPIPPYTMVIAVGKFAVTRLPDAACSIRCVPQAIWTFPEDSAFAVAGPFRRVGPIVEFYSRLIGPFPYSGLTHVEAITPYGGMENATAIFYNDSLYRARTLPEQTVAHEIAHQWFGDAVTEEDWHHLWLSEGFATYLAAMWAEQSGGPAALAAAMRGEAQAYFASPDVERPILDPQVRNLDSLLNENNYQKGAWVLHQLRGMIGDSAFVAGLRLYYQRYRDSTALSDEFAKVMSEAAGRDLDWYFRQALTQPGYPILEIHSSRERGKLVIEVRQVQKAEWGTYRLPGLELVLDGKLVRLDVEGRIMRATVDGLSRIPSRVEVDPRGRWLLKSVNPQTVRGEPAVLLTLWLAGCGGLSPLRGHAVVGRDPYLVFVGDGPGGQSDLFGVRGDGGPVFQITYTSVPEMAPRLSPNGDAVAFLRGSTADPRLPDRVWVLNLLSGAEREFKLPRDAAPPDGLGWSEDGRWLYVRASGVIYRVAAPPAPGIPGRSWAPIGWRRSRASRCCSDSPLSAGCWAAATISASRPTAGRPHPSPRTRTTPCAGGRTRWASSPARISSSGPWAPAMPDG